MAGRLGANLRSGNLAEAVGVLLLKGIAAVADVPRTEDVGLDAVASLLRYDNDGNCYAEDNFGVQLKAESVTEIPYQDSALDWLLGQELPMFIGRVSLARSCLALYPTMNVNQAVMALHAKQVTVRFGTSNLPAFIAGRRFGAWKGEEGDSATVWLGEPILDWSIADITDPGWRTRTYAILKEFLRLARREQGLSSFGQWTTIDWTTNDLGSIKSSPCAMKGNASDLKQIAEMCTPGLQALMLQAITMPEESGGPLFALLASLAAVLRDHGADVDPEGIFTLFGVSRFSKKE